MAKSADGKTNRLTDMIVKEVSLVDRAANKRQFLITKRDGSHMATKLVADGNGGFTTVEVTKAAEAPAVAPTAATAPATAAPAVPPAPTSDVEKAETLDKLGALAERVLGVAKAFRDNGVAVPEGFHDEVSSMVLDIQKRRMGKARMDKLETGLATLTELVAELKGETDTTKAQTAPATAPVVAAPVVAPAIVQSDDVTKRLAQQEAEIAKLRGAPVPSNSRPEEGGAAPAAPFAWPTDMATSKRSAQNKAAGLEF